MQSLDWRLFCPIHAKVIFGLRIEHDGSTGRGYCVLWARSGVREIPVACLRGLLPVGRLFKAVMCTDFRRAMQVFQFAGGSIGSGCARTIGGYRWQRWCVAAMLDECPPSRGHCPMGHATEGARGDRRFAKESIDRGGWCGEMSRC